MVQRYRYCPNAKSQTGVWMVRARRETIANIPEMIRASTILSRAEGAEFPNGFFHACASNNRAKFRQSLAAPTVFRTTNIRNTGFSTSTSSLASEKLGCKHLINLHRVRKRLVL